MLFRDIVIFDFSKVFDTVPCRKLLHKLENYGIRSSTHKWMLNFLLNRTIKVVLDGESSDEVSVDTQGCHREHLLGRYYVFATSTISVPDCVKSQVRLFAYDCLLYHTIHSFQNHSAVQNDLHELKTWTKNWGMHFNSKKCYILSVHLNSQFFYTLNGDILKLVEDNPYLGVLLSEDMKWHKHISNVTKKASQTLGLQYLVICAWWLHLTKLKDNLKLVWIQLHISISKWI